MELLEELHALQRDLAGLSDSVAVGLLQRAEKCFLSWRFDDGERFLEQALSRLRESLAEPPTVLDVARYFATCAMVGA